jgi:hypothetical protein
MYSLLITEIVKNMSATTVLFSSLPKREDICCVVGYVNSYGKHASSAKSSYHWQIFRCRYKAFIITLMH